MRKDSELFLRKLLDYRRKIGKDSFEINIRYFMDIPNIITAINDILEDLITNSCITSKSQLLNSEYDILIYLTLDGIEYFNDIKSKKNMQQNIFNVYSGQVSVATDNAKIDAVVNHNGNVTTHKTIKSRTQEYADKWNQNMFLNNFDKHDKNTGVNVTLKDIYLESHLPHYIWKDNNNKIWKDLKDLLSEYIDKKSNNKMLLILGQPGIGKSTLITWITANFIDRMDKILVYQFASSLKYMDYQNTTDVSDELCKMLDLSYDDLEGKTLILDGFDEINIGNRIEILNSFYWKLIKNSSLKQFSLIITCRENYIYDLYKSKFNYITLKPLSEKQIQSFCHIYQEKTNRFLSKNTMSNIIENKNILGIPLILYMVLALDITLENNNSIVDVYDKIFSLKEGGIYDRCIGNAGYADLHRISSIKRQIHLISEKIAFWMFENNSEEEYIPQKEYQKICTSVMQESMNQDFLIGNFFKLVRHCEGIESERLYFVHRSIYEYFVTVYILNSVYEVIYKSKEEIASVLGDLFKHNKLSVQILQFLKYKIKNSKLNIDFDIIIETFQLMLQDGMTYYTHKCYKNVIDCEMVVFSNMLEIMHLWEKNINISLFENFDFYLRYNSGNILNLEKMNLKDLCLEGVDLQEANLQEADLKLVDLTRTHLMQADLKGANLTEANLRGADLSDATLIKANLIEATLIRVDLRGADLREANLIGANLKGADLNEADLRWVNLTGANLKGADLSEADLRGVQFKMDLIEADLSEAKIEGAIFDENKINYLKDKYDLHGIKVYIWETKDIISYEEYCKRK